MHTVDLLEEALRLADRNGFQIRREWLGASTGGACRVGTNWQLFVDLSLPPDEQLTQVVRALRASGVLKLDVPVSRALAGLLRD